jgi:hypothetical protein
MATFSIEALHAELFTDPMGLGYNTSGDDDNAPSAMLNTIREGEAYLVDRDPVPTTEVFSLAAPDDFSALTDTQLARLQAIFTLQTINLADDNVRTNLANIFGNNSPTQHAIVAFRKRQGSRAEVLWGPGTVVMSDQVKQAFELP